METTRTGSRIPLLPSGVTLAPAVDMQLRIVVPLSIGLFACSDSVENRLAELDARVTVDCGYVSNCAEPAHADAVAACLRDNLTANVGAKAIFVLGLDPVAHVYALDGSFVSVEGYFEYYDDGEIFTEYHCQGVLVTTSGSCARAQATECDPVREW